MSSEQVQSSVVVCGVIVLGWNYYRVNTVKAGELELDLALAGNDLDTYPGDLWHYARNKVTIAARAVNPHNTNPMGMAVRLLIRDRTPENIGTTRLRPTI